MISIPSMSILFGSIDRVTTESISADDIDAEV